MCWRWGPGMDGTRHGLRSAGRDVGADGLYEASWMNVVAWPKRYVTMDRPCA